jgi:peptidase E
MKLLLTSLGTTNKQVMDELIRLNVKRPQESNILFITTAAKLVENPQYMYNELTRLKTIGFHVQY